jgi:hypothetical protein
MQELHFALGVAKSAQQNGKSGTSELAKPADPSWQSLTPR